MTGDRSRYPLIVLLALSIARLWLVPLTSSFWVDELVTVFVVKHPGHPSFAAAPQVPQSIYYWLPRLSSALFGESEAAYRIPSMVAMAIALWLLARLASRLIHPRAGWFTVFAALSLRGIDYFAIDARPYALGMLAATASIYFLVRWLDSARWADAILFVLSTAAVWWVQLIFWPFYIVIAICLIVRNSVPKGQLLVVLSAIVAAILPRALAALELAHGAPSHAFAALPTLHVFEHELHWNLPVLCAAAMWLLTRFTAPQFSINRWRAPKFVWVIVLSWWLCQPVVLYLYSHLTGNSVYVGRYLSVMLPAVALMATLAVAHWMPPQRWAVAAAAMAIVALITQSHYQSFSYRHDISDWRSAREEVNRFAADGSTPVIVVSPFIEGRPPAWSPDYPLPGFLYAHLEGYPVRGRLLLFPYTGPDDPDAVRYADALLRSNQLPGKWILYGEIPGHDWGAWFASRPELAGRHHEVKKFGDVVVVEFTAGTSATPQQ